MAFFRPSPSTFDTMPHSPADPVFVAWTLSWGAHAAVTDPLGYFDANIFHPHELTAAWSDTLLPVVPAWALLRVPFGWTEAVNLLGYVLVLFNLVVTYLLVLRFTERRDSAVVGAVAFGFTSYVVAHVGHLQLQTLGFVGLAWLALLGFLDAPSPRRGAALGVASGCVFLAAAYYGTAWFLVLALVGVHLLATRAWRRPGLVRGTLAAVAAVAVTAGPVAIAYVAVQDAHPDAVRSSELVRFGSLDLVDLRSTAPNAYLWGGLDAGLVDDVEHRLFPGFAPVALAVAGGVVAVVEWRRRPRAGDAGSADTAPEAATVRASGLGYVAGGGALALALAFGPEAYGLPTPYRLLAEIVPGLAGLRVPTRLAVFGVLSVAVLAGVGHAWLTRRLAHRPAVSWSLAIVAVVVVLAELAAPVHRFPFDDRPETLAVYRALDSLPAGVVVELPMAEGATVLGAFTEGSRLLYSTIDWNDRVNGYSGLIPDGHDAVAEIASSFPSPSSLALFDERDVRYVLLHTDPAVGFGYPPEDAERIVRERLPAGATAEQHGRSWLVDLDGEERLGLRP